jgi:hypothetical protein
MIKVNLIIYLAKLKAFICCLLHPDARVYMENTWAESTCFKNLYDEPQYAEVVTFVGVITGNLQDRNLKVFKCYYGKLRFEIDSYNNKEI